MAPDAPMPGMRGFEVVSIYPMLPKTPPRKNIRRKVNLLTRASKKLPKIRSANPLKKMCVGSACRNIAVMNVQGLEKAYVGTKAKLPRFKTFCNMKIIPIETSKVRVNIDFGYFIKLIAAID